MKNNTLYWIAGTGAGVMAVIAVLMAAQPKAHAPAAVMTAALVGANVGGAETGRELWCGLAFRIVAADAPGEDDKQREIVQQYAAGGEQLIEAARADYLRDGYTDEGFKAHLAARTAEIAAEVNATDDSTDFSFEECSALIGL